MKIVISFAIGLLLFCGACSGSAKKQKEAKLDFGKLEGRKYSNKYFNFDIELDEPWVYVAGSKIKSTYFGGTLFEAEYHDPEYDSLLTITLTVTAEKMNPFKSNVSEVSQFKESNDNLTILYDEEELLISKFEKIKVGKIGLTRNHVVILETEEDSLYTDEYAYMKGDYMLSFAFGYRSKTEERLIPEVLKKIMFH